MKKLIVRSVIGLLVALTFATSASAWCRFFPIRNYYGYVVGTKKVCGFGHWRPYYGWGGGWGWRRGYYHRWW